MCTVRKYPVGTEFLQNENTFHCRVWAPECSTIKVLITSKIQHPQSTEFITLESEKNGYFSGHLPADPQKNLYGFIIDNNESPLPDPASRFQPDGISGLSEFVNPHHYRWHDTGWMGPGNTEKIIYEMHIGTFTKEGTWRSAEKHLIELAEIGINVLEIMPVAEFYGAFNWGYDGVFQFAPSHNYGTPDDFRHFVDIAHQEGIAVVLDVVYNHLGRGGNFFSRFSPRYFSTKYKNEWGKAINFDDDFSGPVREYFLCNTACWIEEYHLDGLRIDATQQIFDISESNIISEMVTVARNAAGVRSVYIIAENEPQQSSLIKEFNIDAVWSDDFHRSVMVALTSHNEAYYSDYKGTPQEFISAAKYGYLYQGQYYTWQKKPRGSPSLELPHHCFIHYLQNHDQIANSCRGLRLHQLCSFPLYKTFTALLLLGPQTPMLFQGQEFCSSSPFYYFSDNTSQFSHNAVQGRKVFLSQFRSIIDAEGPIVPRPDSFESFVKSKLNFEERESHRYCYKFHRDLLNIRRTDSVFKKTGRKSIDGAILGPDAFVLRYFSTEYNHDRLLIINAGKDMRLEPNPEPLLAPPPGCDWKTLWYSESPVYNGNGSIPLNTDSVWSINGQTAFFLGV